MGKSAIHLMSGTSSKGDDQMVFYFPLPEKVAKNTKEIAYDCKTCGLCNDERLKSPKMEPFIGDQYDGLVIVANKPSIDDDIKYKPLINEKAKIVRSAFLKNKINLVNKAAITYAVCCQAFKVSDTQYQCCHEVFLKNRLKDLKPKVIIALGDKALRSIMGTKYNISAINARNRVIPNFEFNCVVFPIFDPNAANSFSYKFAIERDIQRICRLWHNNYHKRVFIKQLVKKRKILENITIHEIKLHEIDSAFEEIKALKEVSLDYETTSLKPYDDFFEITHISFGLGRYAWVFHESLWENDLAVFERISNHMRDILTNPDILKVIQNAKYEDLCSRFVFGIKKIVNSFCTMLATHVIDEREGCTSLDFQNYVRFGIPPYSDTVKAFLKKKNKDDLANNIRKAPHDDLILYAGLDVITTFNNYTVLINDILPNAYPQAIRNYNFLHKGHWAFANMSQRGITIDEREFDAFDQKLDENIEMVLESIGNIPEFIEYNKYLEDKDATPKTGDKKLKQLIASTKKSEGSNAGIIGKRKPTKKLLNRKISFK